MEHATSAHIFAGANELILMLVEEVLASEYETTLLNLRTTCKAWGDMVKPYVHLAKERYRSATFETAAGWSLARRLLVRDLALDTSNVRCQGETCHGPKHQLAYVLDALAVCPKTEHLTVTVGVGPSSCNRNDPPHNISKPIYPMLLKMTVVVLGRPERSIPPICAELVEAFALESVLEFNIWLGAGIRLIPGPEGWACMWGKGFWPELDRLVQNRIQQTTVRTAYEGDGSESWDEWSHKIGMEVTLESELGGERGTAKVIVELVMDCQTHRRRCGLKILQPNRESGMLQALKARLRNAHSHVIVKDVVLRDLTHPNHASERTCGFPFDARRAMPSAEHCVLIMDNHNHAQELYPVNGPTVGKIRALEKLALSVVYEEPCCSPPTCVWRWDGSYQGHNEDEEIRRAVIDRRKSRPLALSMGPAEWFEGDGGVTNSMVLDEEWLDRHAAGRCDMDES